MLSALKTALADRTNRRRDGEDTKEDDKSDWVPVEAPEGRDAAAQDTNEVPRSSVDIASLPDLASDSGRSGTSRTSASSSTPRDRYWRFLQCGSLETTRTTSDSGFTTKLDYLRSDRLIKVCTDASVIKAT